MIDHELAEEVRASRESVEKGILHDLGYFGHFLHVHVGGRSGKQHILSKLLTNNGHHTQRELLEMSCISSAALSEVLSKLEAEGLITRTRSEQDGRQLDIVLTKAGIRHANEVVQNKLAFEKKSMEVLSPKERQQLKGMLDRLAKHWQAIESNEEKTKEMGCKN